MDRSCVWQAVSRVYIRKNDTYGPAYAWEVRWCDDDTLYAYALTWFGAWRLACHAVGWKVPK